MEYHTDYDFPCSRTFRGLEAEKNGEHLSSTDTYRLSEEIASEKFWAKLNKPARTPPEVAGKQQKQIEQLNAHILFLENKVNRHLSFRKTKGKY